jgi:hypothetical protein
MGPIQSSYAPVSAGPEPGGLPQGIVENNYDYITWQKSAVMRSVGHAAKFSKTILEVAYDRKMNIQSFGNSSGGHSCGQHANCKLPQNSRHL